MSKPESRYVQRCTGPCKAVRGVSAFRRIAGGGRGAVCRWCADAEKDAKAVAQRRVPMLNKLVAEESRLVGQLEQVRAGIAELREAGVGV